MNIYKLFASILILAVFSGCACRTKKVGPGDDNIGIAGEGRELKDINFAFDSYTLDASSKNVLHENAKWLAANPNRRVQIEGHADERGTSEYNMVLGANRARAAEDYFRVLGVDSSRMSTVSYGEEVPLDVSGTEEAYARNRRDHFNVK